MNQIKMNMLSLANPSLEKENLHVLWKVDSLKIYIFLNFLANKNSKSIIFVKC